MLFLYLNIRIIYLNNPSFVQLVRDIITIPVFCVLFRIMTNLELRHVRVREIY